jgi:type I restriction enzyme S subunit
MAGEWPKTLLSNLTDPDTPVTYGVVKPGPEDPDGVLFIRGGDIAAGRVLTEQLRTITREVSQQYRRTQLRGGEIVVSLVGNPGQVAIVPELLKGANIARQVGLVRLRDDVDTRFVKYFLSSPTGQKALGAHSLGSVQQVINLRDLKTVEIPVPPLPEQRAIAHILGTLDDKIELNRRMSETLEAMARALFKAWFVDFEPVRAKTEGRWRRGESLPGLPAHLYDLFPDRLVNSELGEIPEGWGVGTLGDVADHPRRGVQPNSIEPDTPYIALEHMPKRCIALYDWGVADGLESNKFEFKKGEILFGKLRPYFHKVGVAPVDGVCSTDIVVVAPKSAVWRGFVLGHVSSVAFVEHTNAGSTGTKMPRTSWAEMARYTIALPPQAVARAFTERLQPSIDRIIAGIHESRTLAALRGALLPKLISGELRVKDAENFIGRVV